jgi:hypothetical protein
MSKHSKDEQQRLDEVLSLFRKVLTAGMLGLGLGALLPGGHNATQETTPTATPWAEPGSSSSTSTDAELPNVINVFGQDAVQKSSFHDPINSDWNIMLFRQSNQMRNPANRKAYLDFMKQFDDLKKQFHAADGKSPESIDKIVEQVNQRVSDQIKDHPGNINDFKSPIEMLGNHQGSSQDIAAMNEAALQYIGLSDNRMLVVRTNSAGDAGKGADFDVLIVNDAPEGAPPHFVAALGHVTQLSSTDKHPGQLALIDARNQRGIFFAIPKSGL